jgi:hypothetical protein
MSRVNYPKEFVKPDGRKLVAGGPRDLQRRQVIQPAGELDLSGFKEEFHTLREELRKAKLQQSPDGFFSPEQVDEEIRKAVEQAVKETMESVKNPDYDKHELEVNKLEREITLLKQSLEGKKEVIDALRSNTCSPEDVVIDSKRPQMEHKFIDPLDKDAGKGLKSHIDIIDVSTTEEDDMSKKVDKLKGLLGKLPNKN